MKFFVDFEALQFSGRIISIGCVAENFEGEGFYTLVKPAKKGEKVNNFITELTGITNEMLEDAPTADQAFDMFYQYIRDSSKGELPEFYCYGDSDKDFLKATAKYLTCFNSYIFCKFLSESLIDYSRTVSTVFSTLGHSVSLKKVYNLIQEDTEPQKHNALEDAVMLRTVVADLFSHCSEEDKEKLAAMPSTRITPRAAKSEKKAPERFINWPSNKMDADTGATRESNWQYKWSKDGKAKYFDTFDTMTMWAIRYITQGRSIKKESDVAEVKRKITNAIQNKTKFMNSKWEKREVEFIG